VAAPPAQKLERLVGILREYAGEPSVKLIVIDSWRYLVNTFLGYNENAFVDCTIVWDALRAVCKDEGCAMLVIAHFKKQDSRDRGDGLSQGFRRDMQ
jgi:RecA-family ATPase